MTDDNNNASADIPSTWEIYKDAWRNDRRWRWEVILLIIVLTVFFVWALNYTGVM